MADVFISYSSLDRDWAEGIANVLSLNAITHWIAPDHIPGGSNYTTEIPKAIQNCVAFMILVTENSIESPWVRKELDTAITMKKLIIPLIPSELELKPDFAFLLNGVQHYRADGPEDPTYHVLARIRSEKQACAEKAQETKESEPQIDNVRYHCPKCGCDFLNNDYRHTTYTQISKGVGFTRYCWLTILPLFAGILTHMILRHNSYYCDEIKQTIFWCACGCALFGLLTEFFLYMRPKIRQQFLLRRNLLEKHVSCCKCGYRFRIKYPADEYVFNQQVFPNTDKN